MIYVPHKNMDWQACRNIGIDPTPLEVAENASAAMLARSQRQGAALEAGRRRLTKLEQEVRMMKSKNQAELRRLQRKLESRQRDKAGDD